MEKKADEETTPTEKQLRTGGDMSPRGRTVLHVRAPEKVERREQLLFIAWIGGGGFGWGEGGGSKDLRENHMVFLGGRMGDQSSPTGVSANRIQKVDYRGNHQNTTKPKGRTDPPIPPPLPSHGDKQIRPQNQHYQRKNSVALETIKLCVKRSSHFCQRNISRLVMTICFSSEGSLDA